MPEIDRTHVDKTDLRDRMPLTREQEDTLNGHDGQPSWRPTRKWWRAFAGSVASILASWIVTGAFDDVERGMTGTALIALAAAYFSENDPTPGGVPEKD